MDKEKQPLNKEEYLLEQYPFVDINKTLSSFSHSKVDCFMSCPYKFKLRYLHRITSKKKSLALALGACMAEGLRHFRSTGEIDSGADAFVQTWEKEGKILHVKKAEDPLRSVERGLEILYEYALNFPDDPEKTIKPEIRFDEEIFPGIRFCGRIDGLMQVDRGLAINEDKTTSYYGDKYASQIRNSYQVLWYLWIAKHLGLYEVTGKRPSILLNFIYIHAQKFNFPRQLIPKTYKEVDESFNRLFAWINHIIHTVKSGIFPKADISVCNKFGGCEYLPLRDSVGSVFKAILKNEYELKVRNEHNHDEKN